MQGRGGAPRSVGQSLANNDNTEYNRAKAERGWGDRGLSTTHDNQQKATWARHLFWSFLNDKKLTSLRNEMGIWT